MTEQRRSFLGVPVEGSIDKSGKTNKPQRSLAEFQQVFKPVLEDPTIVEFGWKQYTPYFNDGEPCYFHTYGFWLHTTEDAAALALEGDEDYEDWEYEVNSSHPSLGKVFSSWDPEVKAGTAVIGEYRGPDKARFDRCYDLAEAVDGGEFYDVLYDLFGDHAEVTVHKDRIVVDEYSHD